MTRRASEAQNSFIRAGDQNSVRKTLSNAELDELEDLDDGLDAFGPQKQKRDGYNFD